jgi:hypothetical protein
LKTGLCVLRERFAIVSPDPRHLCRFQAELPLIALSEFAQPPLFDAFAIAGQHQTGAIGTEGCRAIGMTERLRQGLDIRHKA